MGVGTHIGRFKVVAQIGAGGMGEVYRAHDSRLGRDVAIKVLPHELRTSEARLIRFEQEARAAGTLNHPNVVALFDVGSYEDAPFVVTELLEGASLRKHIQGGPIPVRRALEWGVQIAQGLAAAHDKGITHRDLKPENIFVTRDGIVKILDFGLAKLTQPEQAAQGSAQTIPNLTDPDTAVGTPAYMSPEQVRAQPVDQRSDLFSLGVVLHEMLSGRHAFQGTTAADVMGAILRDDPAALTGVPPAVERIVRRCLEKSAAQRFQSARDLAFALEALELGSTTSGEPPAVHRSRSAGSLGIAAGVAVAALVLAFVAGRTTHLPSHAAGATAATDKSLRYTQLTFHTHWVDKARFAPDGKTIVYSVTQGGVSRVYSTTPANTERRSLGDPGTGLLAVSSAGEMALQLTAQPGKSVLARAALAGGPPRPVLDDVSGADWSPDGRELLVVQRFDPHGTRRSRIEYPIGHVLLESDGGLTARLSPRGDKIALVERKTTDMPRGRLELLSLDGSRRPLTDDYPVLGSIAWSADGREVWFTSVDRGNLGTGWLRAVSLDGRLRTVLTAPMGALLEVHDIAADGRVLFTLETYHLRVAGMLMGQDRETNLGGFDGAIEPTPSPDGRSLLFSTFGQWVGQSAEGTYLREGIGGEPVRLGDGIALDLSPDGKWALVASGSGELALLPTGIGTPRKLGNVGLDVTRGFWFPDGKRLLLMGRAQGRPYRVWVLDVEGGAPRPLTDEGVISLARPSPDGRLIAAVEVAAGRVMLVPVSGGTPQRIDKLPSGDMPIAWTQDGRGLFVRQVVSPLFLNGSVMTRGKGIIHRYDLATGKRTLWRELESSAPDELEHIDLISVSPDGRSYAYGYASASSVLFLAEGVR